jgi:ribosome-associated protein
MDEANAERPSKTQLKKQMHELQSLGERLVELNPEQLASIGLPGELRDAVDEARRVKSHEARRRQMQYIGRLMREVDPAPIREKLSGWEGRSRARAVREHEIAGWRERLMDDDAALAEFASQHPLADIQHLRTLVRSARADRDAGRAPRHYREIFRALRGVLEPAPESGEE